MAATLAGARLRNYRPAASGPPWDHAQEGPSRAGRPARFPADAVHNWGLCAGTLLGAFLAAEVALGVAPMTRPRVLTPAGLDVSLDCYPTNPRGYFDLDLRDPAVRGRFKALQVHRAGDCAARAPFAVELRYNSLQFRDREPPPRRPHVRRVIVLGDSFTEGQGVKETDVYPRVLERALNARPGDEWEVLNFGHRGADFPILHDTFDRLLAFGPDVVVYGMMLNDCEQSPAFRARHPDLSARLTGRSRAKEPARDTGFGRHTASFFWHRLDRLRLHRDTTAWYGELYGDPNREGWTRTRDQIREMDRRLRLKGGHFLVATWPVLTDLDGEYPFRKVHETVGRFCHAAGIAWLDLLPVLRGHEASDLWVHPLDAHPNHVAHGLVGAYLAPAVRNLAGNPARITIR